MSAIRVLKFGGAALRDGASVLRACRITLDHGGARPVVVVSAHEGVTDLLETAARAAVTGTVDIDALRIRHRSLLSQLGLDSELADRYLGQLRELLLHVAACEHLSARDLDLAYSFGERISARIVAHAFHSLGVHATPVDAYDLGLLTDSNHGRARPLPGIGRAIRAGVASVDELPVVTGFLAKDRAGNLTTLGRNGSDLTASVLAEALGAVEIQFWKSVPGILTADPNLVPEARCLAELSYEEAAECAFHGARVLHPACVAPVVRAQVAVRVLDVRDPDAPGTVFETSLPARGPVAIASRADVVRIDVAVERPEQRGELASRMFATLDECGLSHGLLSADGSRVSAVVDNGIGLPAALDRLGDAARLERDLAVVAVVGQNVGHDTGVGLAGYERLKNARIDVVEAFLGDREASQAFLVRGPDLAQSVALLHDTMLAGGPAHR